MTLQLRNPHSVLAALKTRPGDVLEIRLSTNQAHGAWEDVVKLAEEQRVPVGRGSHQRQQARNRQTERQSSAEATVREGTPTPLDELFGNKGKGPQPVWLALDCLTDPHNVGAIFRTAAFWGIQGVVLTKDRSAPLNATVYDVASGGLEYVPWALETNLTRSLEVAKKNGLWVLGTSEHAEEDVQDIPRDRPWLVVVGNEEQGIRRLTREHCDSLCKITPQGAIQSLNASVATATMLATLLRRGE